MGDRGNIVVRTEPGTNRGDIWMYTHWGGSELHTYARKALARGEGRWDDPSYLARIVFCDMVQGMERETTSFGLSASIGDNDGYPILVIDPFTDDGIVWELDETWLEDGRLSNFYNDFYANKLGSFQEFMMSRDEPA